MSKKNKQEEIAEKAVAHAKTIKEVAEENMREKLYEAFSPQLKKMISQSILEMDDEEEDMDMDDMDMEEGEDMDFDDEEYMEEEEGSDAEADELDPEDLEDLEKALDEEGDDLDGDGHEEVPTDVADEIPDEEEELEEASDDYDDMEEETPEDFMAELQALIDEVDAEEMNESEDGGSYTDKDKGDGGNTKKYEGEDGGSYTDKDKGDGGNTKKYEGEDEDDDVDALKEENKKLKATISEINKQLEETVLDEYKTNKFTKLVKEHRITESAKLKLMRAIDSGKSEREVNQIAEVFEKTLPKRKKKKSIKENKGGRNSSMRKPLGKKKNLKENKKAGSTSYDFADRMAELADISR